jgi:hypothetical protein
VVCAYLDIFLAIEATNHGRIFRLIHKLSASRADPVRLKGELEEIIFPVRKRKRGGKYVEHGKNWDCFFWRIFVFSFAGIAMAQHGHGSGHGGSSINPWKRRRFSFDVHDEPAHPVGNC